MKKEKAKKKPHDSQLARLLLAVEIAMIYFLCAGSLVFTIIKYQVPLTAGDPGSLVLLRLLWFVYYGLPLFFAALFGLVVKPFWCNFRNLLVFILFVQVLYSFGAFLYRLEYLQQRADQLYSTRQAKVRVFGAKHLLQDNNQDGAIDNVQFSASMDVEALTLGSYEIYAQITQKGMTFPDGIMGKIPLVLAVPMAQPIRINFQKDPRIFEPYYDSGPFDINVGVRKFIPVDPQGLKVQSITRWSPFIRTTRWDGSDPDIGEHTEDIANARVVDRFMIMPLKLNPAQMVLTEGIMDYGRDDDGDGLFEAIVLVLPLFSEYEGPVYVQALLAGAKEVFMVEKQVVVGENALEVPIDVDFLKKLGTDGPYELMDFQIYNKNPECTSGECLKKIKPFFTLHLDNYVTSPYKLDQFRK